MPQFKQFIKAKLGAYIGCFKRGVPLLDSYGHVLPKIDLSFRTLTQEFLKLETLADECALEEGQGITISGLKLRDSDLEQFLLHLNDSWEGELDLSGNLLSDETAIRLAKILQSNSVIITKLWLDDNRITGIGGRKLGASFVNNRHLKAFSIGGVALGTEGSNFIIESINANPRIREYNLGRIGCTSFIHLSQHLALAHKVYHLAFGQDPSQSWTQASLTLFDQTLRNNQINKQLLSINITPEHPDKLFRFVNEVALLCYKNRRLQVKLREDEYKSQALNTQNPKYYDPDNHGVNAYKFSVKSYLQNVFGSTLDESLYMLEKQRQNKLREDAIFEITKQVKSQKILQDICTADGSIIVLAHFLLSKIKQPL